MGSEFPRCPFLFIITTSGFTRIRSMLNRPLYGISSLVEPKFLVMLRNVYVTLSVDFLSSGDWCKDYFLGLDSNPRLAVQYPISRGAYLYAHQENLNGFERVYKIPNSNRGYAILKETLYFD